MDSPHILTRSQKKQLCETEDSNKPNAETQPGAVKTVVPQLKKLVLEENLQTNDTSTQSPSRRLQPSRLSKNNVSVTKLNEKTDQSVETKTKEVDNVKDINQTTPKKLSLWKPVSESPTIRKLATILENGKENISVEENVLQVESELSATVKEEEKYTKRRRRSTSTSPTRSVTQSRIMTRRSLRSISESRTFSDSPVTSECVKTPIKSKSTRNNSSKQDQSDSTVTKDQPIVVDTEIENKSVIESKISPNNKETAEKEVKTSSPNISGIKQICFSSKNERIITSNKNTHNRDKEIIVDKVITKTSNDTNNVKENVSSKTKSVEDSKSTTEKDKSNSLTTPSKNLKTLEVIVEESTTPISKTDQENISPQLNKLPKKADSNKEIEKKVFSPTPDKNMKNSDIKTGNIIGEAIMAKDCKNDEENVSSQKSNTEKSDKLVKNLEIENEKGKNDSLVSPDLNKDILVMKTTNAIVKDSATKDLNDCKITVGNLSTQDSNCEELPKDFETKEKSEPSVAKSSKCVKDNSKINLVSSNNKLNVTSETPEGKKCSSSTPEEETHSTINNSLKEVGDKKLTDWENAIDKNLIAKNITQEVSKVKNVEEIENKAKDNLQPNKSQNTSENFNVKSALSPSKEINKPNTTGNNVIDEDLSTFPDIENSSEILVHKIQKFSPEKCTNVENSTSQNDVQQVEEHSKIETSNNVELSSGTTPEIIVAPVEPTKTKLTDTRISKNSVSTVKGSKSPTKLNCSESSPDKKGLSTNLPKLNCSESSPDKKGLSTNLKKEETANKLESQLNPKIIPSSIAETKISVENKIASSDTLRNIEVVKNNDMCDTNTNIAHEIKEVEMVLEPIAIKNTAHTTENENVTAQERLISENEKLSQTDINNTNKSPQKQDTSPLRKECNSQKEIIEDIQKSQLKPKDSQNDLHPENKAFTDNIRNESSTASGLILNLNDNKSILKSPKSVIKASPIKDNSCTLSPDKKDNIDITNIQNKNISGTNIEQELILTVDENIEAFDNEGEGKVKIELLKKVAKIEDKSTERSNVVIDNDSEDEIEVVEVIEKQNYMLSNENTSYKNSIPKQSKNKETIKLPPRKETKNLTKEKKDPKDDVKIIDLQKEDSDTEDGSENSSDYSSTNSSVDYLGTHKFFCDLLEDNCSQSPTKNSAQKVIPLVDITKECEGSDETSIKKFNIDRNADNKSEVEILPIKEVQTIKKTIKTLVKTNAKSKQNKSSSPVADKKIGIKNDSNIEVNVEQCSVTLGVQYNIKNEQTKPNKRTHFELQDRDTKNNLNVQTESAKKKFKKNEFVVDAEKCMGDVVLVKKDVPQQNVSKITKHCDQKSLKQAKETVTQEVSKPLKKVELKSQSNVFHVTDSPGKVDNEFTSKNTKKMKVQFKKTLKNINFTELLNLLSNENDMVKSLNLKTSDLKDLRRKILDSTEYKMFASRNSDKTKMKQKPTKIPKTNIVEGKCEQVGDRKNGNKDSKSTKEEKVITNLASTSNEDKTVNQNCDKVTKKRKRNRSKKKAIVMESNANKPTQMEDKLKNNELNADGNQVKNVIKIKKPNQIVKKPETYQHGQKNTQSINERKHLTDNKLDGKKPSTLKSHDDCGKSTQNSMKNPSKCERNEFVEKSLVNKEPICLKKFEVFDKPVNTVVRNPSIDRKELADKNPINKDHLVFKSFGVSEVPVNVAKKSVCEKENLTVNKPHKGLKNLGPSAFEFNVLSSDVKLKGKSNPNKEVAAISSNTLKPVVNRFQIHDSSMKTNRDKSHFKKKKNVSDPKHIMKTTGSSFKVETSENRPTSSSGFAKQNKKAVNERAGFIVQDSRNTPLDAFKTSHTILQANENPKGFRNSKEYKEGLKLMKSDLEAKTERNIFDFSGKPRNTKDADKAKKETKGNELQHEKKPGIKRLPFELLEALTEKPVEKKEKRKDAQPLQQDERQKKKTKKLKIKSAVLDEGYIPLTADGATQFAIARLDKELPLSTAQQAANFRSNHLYGSHNKRISAKELQNMSKKYQAFAKE